MKKNKYYSIQTKEEEVMFKSNILIVITQNLKSMNADE